MVSIQEYEGIQQRILSIIKQSDSPVDPSDILVRLHDEKGVSRELISAIMWEMIRAGYLDRSMDWRVSLGRRPMREVGMLYYR